jgi:hypothetical protein
MLLRRASRNALDAVFSSATTQATYACPAAFIKEQMRVNTAASASARGQKFSLLPPTFSHMWTPDLNFNNEPESKKIDPELPLGSRGGKAAKASI